MINFLIKIWEKFGVNGLCIGGLCVVFWYLWKKQKNLKKTHYALDKQVKVLEKRNEDLEKEFKKVEKQHREDTKIVYDLKRFFWDPYIKKQAEEQARKFQKIVK